MTFIRNLPGPLLIFLGALSLSFGGLIVKSFEGATLWQILFWRSLFFSLTVLAFLILSYRGKTIESFYKSGLPGFLVELFYLLVFVDMCLLCTIPLLLILILSFHFKYYFLQYLGIFSLRKK